MMKLSGMKVPLDMFMLAAAVDRLSNLVWLQTDDGAKGRHQPESIARKLLGIDTQDHTYERFETAADFQEEWKRRTGVKQWQAE